MRTYRNLFFAILLVIAVPVCSSAEVKITLKNGRSFIADSCKKDGGRLLCEMHGGTMEIDMKDIARTEDVKGRSNAGSEQRFEPMGEDRAGDRETPEKSAVEKQATPAEAAGQSVRGLSPEQSKRFAEINKRKNELTLERENLIRDRERLYDDIKNAGVVKTQEQFDAIKSRISDLESRITRLNDQVKNLNDEENSIFRESNAK